MPATPTASPVDLAQLLRGTGRIILAGHPRPMARLQPGSRSTVHQPKELLMELVEAPLLADGGTVTAANPHFLPITDWTPDLAVLHFSALEVACPVPIARNLQVIDGEDLLGLAEEARMGERAGIRRQRAGLMDMLLTLPPAVACEGVLPGDRPQGQPNGRPQGRPQGPSDGRPDGRPDAGTAALSLAPLVTAAASLPAGGARPVQWLPCVLETGPYNFLNLRRNPKLETSHVRVMVDSGARGGQVALVAFATPATIGELGPVLRAFAALAPDAPHARLLVFFFGTPEELFAALAERPQATFFGDNFRCPAIRFLFGPFAALDLMHAVGAAACSIDTCYGGVLDGVARAAGVRHRIVVATDGSFDADEGDATRHAGIAWDDVFGAAALSHRRHKTDRAQERVLLQALEAVLRGASA